MGRRRETFCGTSKEEHTGGASRKPPLRMLTDEDFLYLHDNYVVTAGNHEDGNVIFDDVTLE